jgi:hypothetical protein
LIHARNHGLAIRPYIGPKVRELFDLVQGKLIEFE